MSENLALNSLKQKGYFELFSENNWFEQVIDLDQIVNLINNWPSYKDLTLIVIGSSPVDYFNSSGAFVGEPLESGKIPKAVENFRKALNSAFYSDVSYNKIDCDYDSRHAKQSGILFINVCLTEGKDRYDIATFTIGFINQILKRKYCDRQQIAILDMRLDIHSHISEEAFEDEKYLKPDERYKIENLDGFHRLERVGHPGYMNELKIIIESLLKIRKNNPEIACIHRNIDDCLCR